MSKRKSAGKAARPCKLPAAHFTTSDENAALAAQCQPRTVTATLDVFPTPFPIKEWQALEAARLAYEIAQMKRVTFTVGGAR